MENILKFPPPESLRVLLIGNNPLEMSDMLVTLSQFHGSRILMETEFDVKNAWRRLLKFAPNYILIDDNIGDNVLTQTVYSLSRHRKTKNIPITLLKNSNYKESIMSADILDFVLKQNLTSEALYNALKNSLKLKRAKLYLIDAYRKRKGLLKSLVS